MKTKTNQKGNVLFIVLILVVLVGLVGAGLYVYKHRNTSNTASTNPPTPGAQTPTPTPTPSTAKTYGYLEIKEFGVKLKLDANTQDLVYHIDKTGIAKLSSTSLAAEVPSCAADYGSGFSGVGSVSFFTDPNGMEADGNVTNIEAFPKALLVNGKYYYIQTNQMFCVDGSGKDTPADKAYQIESKLVSSLRRTVTLEKI